MLVRLLLEHEHVEVLEARRPVIGISWNIMTKTIGSLLLVCLAAGAFPVAVGAQRPPPADLAQATIEELMDMRVTSAARKSQRAEDVAAAMYVITRDDIRRSGLATLPEILRLAPGVQVAQVNASKWAISIRGFGEVYSNKLLVLVDGRSVYTRTFSGVFWDMQDLMVSDIDRIEVIRGPGGVTWGANAVNGVINIITRPAAATPGVALDVSGGTLARERIGVRYGGRFGGADYRVFSQWSGYSDGPSGGAATLADRWHSLTSGLRADWSRGPDAFMAQGHLTTNRARPGWLEPGLDPGRPPVTDGISHASEASILGRWTRTRADGTVLQVQAYHSRLHRDEPIIAVTELTSDLDVQYETRLGSRHGVVLGGGYRRVDISADEKPTARMGSPTLATANLFFQDEIALRRDVALTLGAKLEYDTLAPVALLPTARVIWEVSPRQRLWAAASRAHRTPALTDRDFRVNLAVLPGPGLPVVVAFVGNPAYGPESLLQTEAGYRVRIGPDAALDVTTFSGAYDGLTTLEPLPPVLETTPAPQHLLSAISGFNLLDTRASGVEINAHWTPLAEWQIEASYALLHVTADVPLASHDLIAAATDGNAPTHQWDLRSTVSVHPGVRLSASIARVGRLRQLQVLAYTRLDARAEWGFNSRLTVAAVGQNLLTARHTEFWRPFLVLTSDVPRSARLDLRWTF